MGRCDGVLTAVLDPKGTFQTPQILELSGIGKKDILSKHGIETLIDNPSVGENLRECLWQSSESVST